MSKNSIVWHYEMPNLQKLCRPISPLMDSGVPAMNTTLNPKYVTCPKCLDLLKQREFDKEN